MFESSGEEAVVEVEFVVAVVVAVVSICLSEDKRTRFSIGADASIISHASPRSGSLKPGASVAASGVGGAVAATQRDRGRGARARGGQCCCPHASPLEC